MDSAVQSQRFAVVDTETTGLDPQSCRMLQLGIVIARSDGSIESEFVTYVRQDLPGFGKLGAFDGHPMIEHFKFLQAHTTRTPKMTIPSQIGRAHV